MEMEIEKLKELLNKWQKRLGLSDWEIDIGYNDHFDNSKNSAKTIYWENTQNARIRILDPKDRQKSNPVFKDIELDLVHELIHIRLWAIDPNDPDDILHVCREQAVEWIAKALIKADRGE